MLFNARLAVIALSCILCAGSASASTITVNNFSFETLPSGGLTFTCPAGGPSCAYSQSAIPGWTNTGSSGQFRPGAPGNTTYFDTVPDGTVVGYSNGPTISQIVIPTVVPGYMYLLRVDIGLRKDQTGPVSGGADLRVGGVPYLATGTAPLSGDWSTYTAAFEGTALTAGDNITIELTTANTGGNFSQGDFDNVHLSVVTPEPALMALAGLALCGFGLIGRRKSRR